MKSVTIGIVDVRDIVVHGATPFTLAARSA
jgi:hypothetical protein